MQATSTSTTKTPPLSPGANDRMQPPTLSFTLMELSEEGERVLNLRLELANGNRFFFPYAYLIQVEYLNSEGALKLYTAEKEIIITGRGLDQVEECLYNNEIKTLKESKIALIQDKNAVFIKSINVTNRF